MAFDLVARLLAHRADKIHFEARDLLRLRVDEFKGRGGGVGGDAQVLGFNGAAGDEDGGGEDGGKGFLHEHFGLLRFFLSFGMIFENPCGFREAQGAAWRLGGKLFYLWPSARNPRRRTSFLLGRMIEIKRNFGLPIADKRPVQEDKSTAFPPMTHEGRHAFARRPSSQMSLEGIWSYQGHQPLTVSITLSVIGTAALRAWASMAARASGLTAKRSTAPSQPT